MNIKLSDHFSYGRLLRYSLPSILMMVFISIYGVVDGFFISNFVGKTPFAAVNFIYPYIMILAAVGFMIGAGGSALIGKTLGEGDRERANAIFSMLVWISIILGLVLAAVGYFTMRPVAKLLGAEEEMLDDCCRYGAVMMIGLPMLILQFEFQTLFVTAEKPGLGLISTLAAGIANMVLDAVLVGVLRLDLEGAASATVISECIGGIFPLIYFSRKNSSLLRLTRGRWEMRALFKTLGNGASEFVSNISMSVVGMLYNAQLMRFAGEDGVSAYGVLMYVSFVFISIFVGYTVGVAPIISFHFGAQNKDELHNLLKKSLVILAVFAGVMLLGGELLAGTFSSLFVGYDKALYDLTFRAFRIYSFSFPLAAIPIFGSSFFTALNDGVTSATISFLRMALFEVAAVLLLPLWLGIDGIWLSVVAAEFAASMVTIIFWIVKKKKFGY